MKNKKTKQEVKKDVCLLSITFPDGNVINRELHLRAFAPSQKKWPERFTQNYGFSLQETIQDYRIGLNIIDKLRETPVKPA